MKCEEELYIKELDKYILATFENKKNENIKPIYCTNTFNYDRINFDLQIRTRKQGDKIALFGDKEKTKLIQKSIKDFFIDKKIPVSERDKIPLLAEGNRILWIIGFRASDYFLADIKDKNTITVTLGGKKE